MRQSEIRKDYLLDNYVIISPGRSRRPRQLREATVKVSVESPFTPDKIASKLIIDSSGRGDGRVVAISNIYSAVSVKNKKAYGYQEVIIETPRPDIALGSLTTAHIERVLALYAKRTAELMKKSRIEYVLCFKNQGAAAGASIAHAHSQVFASSLLPPDVAEEARRAQLYHEENGHSYYADLITHELRSSRRIFEDKQIAVFAPYASAYHYEVWIMTKRQVDNISCLTLSERRSVAQALKSLLSFLGQLGVDYNFFCHQVVSNRHQHFCLKLQPRDSIWAGVELGSGLVINSMAPEQAAKDYRRAWKHTD